jgi:hypothetical protein
MKSKRNYFPKSLKAGLFVKTYRKNVQDFNLICPMGEYVGTYNRKEKIITNSFIIQHYNKAGCQLPYS